MLQIFSILIIILINFLKVNSQTVVWDDYRDMCSFGYMDFNRERNNCEKSDDFVVQKYKFRAEEPFWCILINNTKRIYHKVEFEFSGVRSTRKTDFGQFVRSKVVATNSGDEDEHIEIYNISAALISTFTVYPANLFYDLQNISSIKLDGEEICAFQNVPSEAVQIYPNAERRGRFHFFKKCRWIDNRLHRPPNRCELLTQVIFEEMSLNGEEPFYCIIVDNKSLVPISSSHFELNILFSTENYAIMYTSKNSRTIITKTNYIFNITTDVFYLVITPLPAHHNRTYPFTNVLSLKLNNRESCRLRNNPNEEPVTCGMRKVMHQGLITFGNEAYHGKYPWHAAIYELENYGSQKYICGGSIISTNAILTAGHCIQNTHGVKTPDILRVQLGKHDLSIFNADTKEFRVREVIPHYDFEINYLENDIAILKLENFIMYSNYIQPICLNGQTQDDLFIYRIGYVPGWGKNEIQLQGAKLYDAGMPIIGHQECRRSKRNFFQTFLNERNFCAGFRNGTSVCDGDSGGGLVFQFESAWFLKGIVSLGVATHNRRCNTVEYVLFTDVHKYYDWIYNNIINLSN